MGWWSQLYIFLDRAICKCYRKKSHRDHWQLPIKNYLKYLLWRNQFTDKNKSNEFGLRSQFLPANFAEHIHFHSDPTSLHISLDLLQVAFTTDGHNAEVKNNKLINHKKYATITVSMFTGYVC